MATSYKVAAVDIEAGQSVKLTGSGDGVELFDYSADDLALLFGVAQFRAAKGQSVEILTDAGESSMFYFDGGDPVADGEAFGPSPTVPGAWGVSDVSVALATATVDGGPEGTIFGGLYKGAGGGGGGGITLPLTTDLPFTAAAPRNIYVQDSAEGQSLEVRSGAASGVGEQGGPAFYRSSAGGPTDGVTPAGAGADLMLLGSDAGDNGDDEAMGAHGGNVFIGGGLGNNAAHQHGGILIGTEEEWNGRINYADEIRIGHKPEYGTINQGHIRHIGYLADSLSIHPEDDYTLRFNLKDDGPHIVDTDQAVPDGGNGTSVHHKAGQGGAMDEVAPGGGGDWTAQGGKGGTGNDDEDGGDGGDALLYGGDGGDADGGGGGDGGHAVVDGGAAGDGAQPGQVYIGTDAARTSATHVGHAAALTNAVGLNNPVLSELNGQAQTIKVADQSAANTAGVKLFVRGGKGSPTGAAGDGGDLLLVGGDRGAEGTYGGSVILDGGLPATANAGVVLVGNSNAQAGGSTALVQIAAADATAVADVEIGTAPKKLTLKALPQSASVPTIASAETIAPTTLVCKVSGTTEVDTITLPYAGFMGTIVIVPTGAFPWSTDGNIGLAGTAVPGKALHMTCDGTTFYPSYT